MASLDDVRLVCAARDGDRAAFAQLVERHRPLLVACCRRMLGGDELVDEAVQEAVLQALLGLSRLRQPDRFGPWLAGIGLNVCRRLLRQRAGVGFSPELAVTGAPDGSTADPQELVEAAEVAARVRRAVAALPPGQREAVTLFYLAGLTQREVAAALGIDVGAVKGRLHKARRALRQRLIEFREAVDMSVEMRIEDVERRRAAGGEARHVVVLREVDGERRLRLWVGPYEAEMLAFHLEGLELGRPLTYAFAARLLEAGGATLEEVRISRLSEGTFYADAVVAAGGTSRSVDARPSDALNLAALLGRPVRVAPEVLATADADAPPADEAQSAREIARDVLARIEAARRAAP
ncbi:MAG TPA: bifunctional nuclease domain-containing protein [Candidatus Dormibacteraeota bacterium]|nr:bifunctional nuclease domain-containing protein [Candidatus Dormibacteraeota bacterium]